MSCPISVRVPGENILSNCSTTKKILIKKKKKKLLEDSERNLFYLEFGNDFSDTIPKACSMRERTSKWDSVKFKFLPHMILLRE